MSFALLSAMRRQYWHLKGGPKRNGGRFAMIDGGRLSIGLNHIPAGKTARERASRLRWGRINKVHRWLAR